MQLHDRISRVADGQEFRAYVYMRSAGAEGVEVDGTRLYLEVAEEPRAIIGKDSQDWAVGDLADWRGQQYEVMGIYPRMKRGRVHHYTLDLARPDRD